MLFLLFDWFALRFLSSLNFSEASYRPTREMLQEDFGSDTDDDDYVPQGRAALLFTFSFSKSFPRHFLFWLQE